jgi:hypothetical protein
VTNTHLTLCQLVQHTNYSLHHTHIHTQTNSYTQVHIHTHTHTLTHTHVHTHTHTRTHTYTHIHHFCNQVPHLLAWCVTSAADGDPAKRANGARPLLTLPLSNKLPSQASASAAADNWAGLRSWAAVSCVNMHIFVRKNLCVRCVCVVCTCVCVCVCVCVSVCGTRHSTCDCVCGVYSVQVCLSHECL